MSRSTKLQRINDIEQKNKRTKSEMWKETLESIHAEKCENKPNNGDLCKSSHFIFIRLNHCACFYFSAQQFLLLESTYFPNGL